MPREPAPAPALRDADLPLHTLTRDQLSAFLHLCFVPDELLGLLREAGVVLQGGYRLETLGDVERGDVLAEEILAVPKARRFVIALLRKLYEFPALEKAEVPAEIAKDLAETFAEPSGTVFFFWRLLADSRKEVREAACAGLELVADQLFAEPEPQAANDDTKDKPTEGPTAPAPPSAEMDRLRKQSHAAESEVRRAQKKLGSLKDQLRDARAEVLRLSTEGAAVARAREKATAEVTEVRAELTALQSKEGVRDVARLQKERDELAARVATLDERVREGIAERKRLEDERAAALKQSEEARARPAEPAKESDADVPEELPATWLLPRYTKEFFASLEGWEPRIQRTAFKQAHLLAENHRHPSLRAIPLEGLPGHYRIRIATDVRLIYRRGDSDREIEILSLIDREDLDRYVRQAKTR